MTTGKTCKACKHYKADNRVDGRCRRYPPFIQLPGSIYTLNPKVGGDGTCGEWEL